MMRLPVILAGVAAAVILMRITRRKPEKILESIVPETSLKPVAADTMRSVETKRQETEEIIQVKHLRAPRTLEAKYPGLRNMETKVPVAQR
jgi:hypothetical protein